MNEHVIVCGFGSTGRSAARTLVNKGVEPSRIVVVDPAAEARAQATAQGFAAVAGDGATTDVLVEAGIREARSVVVAVARDDTAVLITLTARELNPSVTIVAAVRDEENVHLLRHSGASSVITTASAAGRLLGHAIDDPRVTEVLEDLLSVGEGVDIAQRPVEEAEVGPLAALRAQGLVVGVIRDGELMRFDDPRAARLEPRDRVVYLHSHRKG